MNDMRKKVVTGLIWTYAERMLAQIISLVVTIILARLITPEHYGVIAIVTVFITIADTFAINGMGNALIQKKNADEIDFSTVFYFNIAFSLLIYVVFFFGAGLLASFYHMPILVPVLRVMSIRIPIAAVNSVQQAYVARRMEFRKFFFATLGGTVVSAILGIALAYCNFGIWALVVQYLSNTFIDTIVLWFTVKWRPKRVFSCKRLKSLFSFGWKLLATSLLITVYSNIQDLAIGKKYTSSELAYSNKGRQFPALISTNINTSITKVLFPAISESQDNIVRVKAITRRAVSVGTYVLSPVLIGLAAISNNFISILLTDKWMGCVPFLKLMCIVYLLQPIQTASIQAMKALGRSDLYFKLEIIKKIFGTIVLVATIFMCDSVMAIIIGSLITELFSSVVNIPVNRKLLKYSYREQFADVIQTIIMTTIMTVVVTLLNKINMNRMILMILQILTGGGVYLVLSVLSNNRDYLYIISIIKSMKKSKMEE